jgi:predicted nucleic acid-binding protein
VSGSILPTFAIDASVATKWYLPDEELVPNAIAVFADYREGRIALLAPDHIQQEVGNAVRNAVRRGRITDDQARAAIQEILTWDFAFVETRSLLASGLELALVYGCALYDALYLALAERADCHVVHADRRLHNTLGGRFARALWIEDYRSP